MNTRVAGRIRSGEDGFTLIELLLVIIILGVIAVPLANAVISYYRNTGATTAELSESHDAQITAAYWAQDVTSLGTRSTGAPYGLLQSVDTTNSVSWPYPCTAAGATPVVRFVGDDYQTGVVRYAYVTQTVAGQLQLWRLTCVNSATPASTAVLAHDLNPASPPTVACSTSCAGSGAAVPVSVTLTLSLKDPKNLNGAYTVTLTGTRRQTS